MKFDPDRHIRQSPIYGSIRVLSPQGNLMFLCDQKKADWYLSRNLAEVVGDHDGNDIIQLTFEPKGQGHYGDDFFLSQKHNHCVVCGEEENLTKHHIVPSCFRRHYPKNHVHLGSHDVVPMCYECHSDYERHANTLKQELAKEYGVECGMLPQEDKDIAMAGSALKALYLHGDTIPCRGKKKLFRQARKVYGNKVYTEDGLREAYEHWDEHWRPKKGKLQYGYRLIEKVDDLQDFTNMWRQHFLDYAKPQFMPDHWDPKKPIFRK